MKQRRWKYNHICLDRAYQIKPIKQEIIKRGYVPHIPYKRKRGQKKEDIIFPKINDGLSREQTLGIIDSESCLQGMKRRLRTTLDWFNYQTV